VGDGCVDCVFNALLQSFGVFNFEFVDGNTDLENLYAQVKKRILKNLKKVRK